MGAQENRGQERVWEAGEERVVSGSPKREGSGRERQNANFFNSTMH